jgi:hypothetical protein
MRPGTARGHGNRPRRRGRFFVGAHRGLETKGPEPRPELHAASPSHLGRDCPVHARRPTLDVAARVTRPSANQEPGRASNNEGES